MSTVTIDRRAYMSGQISHDDYYGQFVTDAVVSAVEASIGEDRIRGSQDRSFNDIPLAEWDALAQRLPAHTWGAVAQSNASTTQGGVPTISLSDKGCLLKAAARSIRGC